jgi:hypothetical protein
LLQKEKKKDFGIIGFCHFNQKVMITLQKAKERESSYVQSFDKTTFMFHYVLCKVSINTCSWHQYATFLPPLSFVANGEKERFWHLPLLSIQSKSDDKNAKRQKRESSYDHFLTKQHLWC